MTTLLNAELSRLCADKGYKRPKGFSQPYYNHLGILNGDVTELVKAQINEEDTTPFQTIAAPTIVEVVMWLYEKHGIWVLVDWMSRIKPFNSGFYSHLRGTTKPLNQDNFISINNTKNPGYEVFNSPTEAYEAAIDYTLNNLI